MSPDIEWHVGEDAEQETIARTSVPRRSRRSRWAVLIAIGLGVGLGLVYRSIPEPPAKPIEPRRPRRFFNRRRRTASAVVAVAHSRIAGSRD